MTTRSNIVGTNQNVCFTLPITCQICLGKVKEPCVCPNLHAFCSFCIEIWLEKTKQCPTCRTPIDKDNPCRRILGGIENVDDVDLIKPTDFSHPSTRKARYLSMFQQYEDEISRLSSYIESLHDELNKFKELNKATLHPTTSPQHDMIQLLKTKLQKLQNNYDNILRERDELKEKNKRLDSENSILIQDNGRLKAVLTEKSNQVTTKYALETKIDGYEKEIKHLQKALEKSDKYIADLEFRQDLKDKENKLNRHLSDDTFNSNSLNVIPSMSSSSSSSTFNYSKANNSLIKPSKIEANKTDLKSVKFCEKIDKYPSLGLHSPKSNSTSSTSSKKNTLVKENIYNPLIKNPINLNPSNSAFVPTASFTDRLKKFNQTVSASYDFDAPPHLSQSLLTMSNNHPANLLISNSSNNFSNQPISHSFLYSPLKRLRIDENNLEKPNDISTVEKKKASVGENLNTSTSEFIDCIEILNRAEKNVQNRQVSPNKNFLASNSQYSDKIYSNEIYNSNQPQGDSDSSSSSGNSLSANGASSSLSSFSNAISSDSSSSNFNNKIKTKKNPSNNKNPSLNSFALNSYNLNSCQNNSNNNNQQNDVVYKEYGQCLNYGNNSGLNLSIVNRSRSVESSTNRNYK